MAAFSKLTVQIGGNIKALQKSLKKSQARLELQPNTTRTLNEAATAGAKGFKHGAERCVPNRRGRCHWIGHRDVQAVRIGDGL